MADIRKNYPPSKVDYVIILDNTVPADKGDIEIMESSEPGNTQATSHFSLYLKYGAIFLLLLMSFIVVACSTADSNTPTTNLAAPPVTVTIQFNNSDLTGLPTQAPYLCGAWITNTSPGFIPGSTIPVYAKFVHLVNENPEGVAGATAQATLYLANGAVTALGTTTTASDGLAIFSFQSPSDASIANRNNLVTVTFTGANGISCAVDQSRAAFFTPMLVTPTPTPTAPGTTPGPGTPIPMTAGPITPNKP